MRIRSRLPILVASLFILQLVFASMLMAQTGSLTPAQGQEMVKKGGVVVLDVRNPDEVVVASYPGSINIPISELEGRLAEVPAGKQLLIHCAKGKRAVRAFEMIQAKRPDIKDIVWVDGETVF